MIRRPAARELCRSAGDFYGLACITSITEQHGCEWNIFWPFLIESLNGFLDWCSNTEREETNVAASHSSIAPTG